jgi:uncharacterized SAM-binding protein YcdF (DUF218 family)
VLFVSLIFIFSIPPLIFFIFVRDIRTYTFDKEKVDAVIVLSGGLGRVEEGLKLHLAEKGEYLIISGVDKASDMNSIFFLHNPTDFANSEKIILEKSSVSTFENARNVKKIIELHGIKSIVLITSSYHMKRAGFIFSRVFPDDVKIFYHTVSTENFNEETWWKDRNSILLLLTEFVKYYWYRLLG